jgi:uncharacterized Zn finger protein
MTASSLPTVTVREIQALVGDESFARAQEYLGKLSAATRSETLLKAHCRGTASKPYRVTVVLRERGGIETTACSCPVGVACKHVAAVLLAWRQDPDQFTEVEPLPDLLARRSKEELIDLLLKVVDRFPDAEPLVAASPPSVVRARAQAVAQSAAKKPPSVAQIRRQVAAAFDSAEVAEGDYYEYDEEMVEGAQVAEALEPLTLLAQTYADAGQYEDAATVYGALADSVAQQYGGAVDDGELAELLDECAAGLAECLHAVTVPAARASIVQALFNLLAWNLDQGNIIDGLPEMIRDAATPDERRRVQSWLEGLLKQSRRAYNPGADALFILRGDAGDDAYLSFYREAGALDKVVTRLLERGRADEAIAEVEQAPEDYVLRLLPLLAARRDARLDAAADRIARARSESSRRPEYLLHWRLERAAARRDAPAVAELTEQLFWLRPTSDGYRQVKEAARAAGTWKEAEPRLVRRLEQQKQFDLLVTLALDDKRIRDAITFLRFVEATHWSGNPGSLHMRVAAAAEQEFPQDAIRLYYDGARRMIAARNRAGYAQAAAYLVRVRDLHTRLGAQEGWTHIIEAVRNEHKALRALQEELRRAGL